MVCVFSLLCLTTVKLSVFPLDLLALEQDAVFGLEALLILCSQDDSPGAQATLKVKTFILIQCLSALPKLGVCTLSLKGQIAFEVLQIMCSL